MSTTIPSQTRTIDPFSNYNSDVINSLTRMVTRGRNCIYSANDVDVSIDTSTSLLLSTGQLFKDNVIISVDSEFTIDMTDSDFYLSGSMNEAGYYWILGHYTYAKLRPAPEMSIVVLKPSQHGMFDSTAHIFLKAVSVSGSGPFQCDEVYDTDPIDPSGTRVYSQVYVGLENSVPVFDSSIDQGRLIYVRNKDSLYFGDQSEFVPVDSVRDVIDTTSCNIGDLVYVGSDGKAYPAFNSIPPVWTITSSLNQARSNLAGCGTTSSSLSFGGLTTGSTRLKTTEKWDGSTWTTTSDLNQTVYTHSGCGTATNAHPECV